MSGEENDNEVVAEDVCVLYEMFLKTGNDGVPRSSLINEEK